MSKTTFPCLKCNKNGITDAIECSLCLYWCHRSCANLSKKEMQVLNCEKYYWYCLKCEQEMPFMQISNDELAFLNYDHSMSREVYKIYNEFKDNQFSVFEKDSSLFNIDCDDFYQDKISHDCKYYLDFEVEQQIKHIDGFSIIHFNARSLKANFSNIKNCIKQIGNDFKVIAISETWLDTAD